ncbi:MAG: hypothetical protein ACI81L_000673 [Verrucomicrobiales bacterium]|jgi:hypothetical protein
MAHDMTASTSKSLERLGSFPPVTAGDWRNMYYGAPTPVNSDAAKMVYDVCWFLVKDGTVAAELTVVTFRVALSRFNEHGLPDPAAYSAWLASIASNEAHRHLEGSPIRRLSSALLEGGSDRDSFYLADTLSAMRADYKLALLLRYRYNTPPRYISMALDMRPRRLARVFVKARDEFSLNSSIAPTMLGRAKPPRSPALPQIVAPYSKREMRQSLLGYGWLESDFPIIPERDERRAKWVTALLTLVILVVIAFAISNPWRAERPTLVDPNTPVVETIDG